MEKLYIPKKINVGYNKRSDTYTGKLGYIIYSPEGREYPSSRWWNLESARAINYFQKHENTTEFRTCEGRRHSDSHVSWNSPDAPESRESR